MGECALCGGTSQVPFVDPVTRRPASMLCPTCTPEGVDLGRVRPGPKGDDTMISHPSGSEAGTYTEWRFTVMPDRTGQPYEFGWSWLEGPVTITEWVDQPLPGPKETEQ